MSYHTLPDHRFTVSTPRKRGAGKTKIELFQVMQFRQAWSLDTRGEFTPALPFRLDDRDIYWTSELFRVKIDDVWLKEDVRYTFMTKKEAVERWVL